MTRVCVAAVLMAAACAPSGERAEAPDSTAVASVPPPPADSLVLQGPGEVQVWFTDARDATAPGGERCVERALEIRDGSRRRGVPLLYTREAPTLLGEGAMRAVLYNHCTAGAAYRVDFATVSPRRITP